MAMPGGAGRQHEEAPGREGRHAEEQLDESSAVAGRLITQQLAELRAAGFDLGAGLAWPGGGDFSGTPRRRHVVAAEAAHSTVVFRLSGPVHVSLAEAHRIIVQQGTGRVVAEAQHGVAVDKCAVPTSASPGVRIPSPFLSFSALSRTGAGGVPRVRVARGAD